MPPWTLGPLRSPWSRTRLKAPLQPCVTINQLVLESSLTVTGNEDNCTSYTRQTPRPAFGHSSKMATWHWCGHTNKFSFEFFFFFLTGIFYCSCYPFFVFKFPFKGVGFSCLEIPGWISSFFFFVGNGVVRMLGWSGSFLMPLTPTIGCCDKIGSLRFVPFKPSVPHYQGQNRAIPAPHYLWNDISCHHHLCTWLKLM